MKAWGITDIGLVRRENQDSYTICQEMPSGHLVCVVCDGMGGAAGGQVASSIGVEVYISELKKVLTAEMSPEQIREASSYVVSLANEAIRSAAAEQEEYQNMGTTLVAAISCGSGMVISNVGDSRAYHITPNGITRVTKDHSLVESMVDQGTITAEEARRHPNRNLITRALGPDTNAQCDGYICTMAAGDFLLLCTDGLVDTVSDQEILFEVVHGAGPDDCLERLLEISKQHGAPDNVTAVLVQNL
ncbi:MAG: Stp1/IreP family PP2C-type Ser/Thr phosphatase [Ruminococcaceae bacterium]|nr:Stp1/IreP family PP2C-type Ser/Thr phosphatase [Oscillospiraceae bacterium]